MATCHNWLLLLVDGGVNRQQQHMFTQVIQKQNNKLHFAALTRKQKEITFYSNYDVAFQCDYVVAVFALFFSKPFTARYLTAVKLISIFINLLAVRNYRQAHVTASMVANRSMHTSGSHSLTQSFENELGSQAGYIYSYIHICAPM